MPLTADRAKPAVPFGGIYRLIDFALSNVVNSGYLKVVVLTQYKSHSLDRHVTQDLADVDDARQLRRPHPGAAAHRQVLVPGQRRRDLPELQHDHRREARHRRRRRRRPRVPDGLLADGRAARRVRRGGDRGRHPAADRDVDRVRRHRRRARRPARRSAPSSRSRPEPDGLPDSPGRDPRSHGQLRLRRRRAHRRRARATRRSSGSKHDMGGDIVPAFVEQGDGVRLRLQEQRHPRRHRARLGYWRDVGTMDSYFDAHMDLVSIHPVFNLYNYDWPIYTSYGPYPPAKFVHGHHGRFGEAAQLGRSPPAVVISGAPLNGSVVSPDVHVHSYTEVDNSVDPRRRADRAELPHPAGDHRQERRRSPRRRRSASTASTTRRAASRSPSPASPSSARARWSPRDRG